MNLKLTALALSVALVSCGGNPPPPPPPPVDTTVLWHASYDVSKVRGYNKALWGTGTASNAQTTLDLAACSNAKINDLIQLSNGDLVLSDNANGRLLRIKASVFAAKGNITLTSAQCVDIGSTPNVIGLARDSSGQSFFAGYQGAVARFDYNAGTDSFTAAQTVVGTNFSGLAVAGDKLYAVDYSAIAVRVYNLAATTRTMTYAGLFTFSGIALGLAEGIAIAGDTLYVADNQVNMSNYRIFGVPVATVNAISGGGAVNISPSKQIFHANNATESFVRCPGGLATDPDGNLWVNVQGSSSASANCNAGNGTPAGNVSKYTAAQLASGSSITTAPSVQISGVATVPGYGGLFFGK